MPEINESSAVQSPSLKQYPIVLLFFASPTSSCYNNKIASVIELFQVTVVVQEKNRYACSLKKKFTSNLFVVSGGHQKANVHLLS
jgi:hypothetical protein